MNSRQRTSSSSSSTPPSKESNHSHYHHHHTNSSHHSQAQAEREVIEDIEPWNDLSDQEEDNQHPFNPHPTIDRSTDRHPSLSPIDHTKSLTKSPSPDILNHFNPFQEHHTHQHQHQHPSQPIQTTNHSSPPTTAQANQTVIPSNNIHSAHPRHPSPSSSVRSKLTSLNLTSSSHDINHHPHDPSHQTKSSASTTTPNSSISQARSDRSISSSSGSKDLSNLIKDPACILTRLKRELDLKNSAAASSSSKTSNSMIGSLPWEAVIPPDLITKHSPSGPSTLNHHHQSSSTPSSTRSENHPAPNYQPLPATPERAKELSQDDKKMLKFMECLEQPTVDVSSLRKLSWSGIPSRLRALVWKILLGYLPATQSRRIEVLARKRQEYLDAVRLAFDKGPHHLDQSIWHQIQIDVARTNPGVPLWQLPTTQRSLERILYVWAIRHPASGYVQGINDLVTPFFQVFLTEYMYISKMKQTEFSLNESGLEKEKENGKKEQKVDEQEQEEREEEEVELGARVEIEVENYQLSNLSPEALEAIEADSFWSVSKLLDGIQDNYIFAQPGIQRQVARLKELCERVDARLHKHLEDEKVEFIQFAFRWINCLLMRELSTKKIIRMWDTYLAEGTAAFSDFHLYVCLALLIKYSDQLKSMDFQSIIIFLQALPTEKLNEKDLEVLLSQAFMWHSLFQGATGHFIRK